MMDRSGYTVYNMDNEEVKSVTRNSEQDALNTVGGGDLTDYHVLNFANAIRTGEKQNSPISEGQKSVIALHLGNISQYVGRSLNIDPESGRIIQDAEAMDLWDREYEPGWEPNV